MLTDNKTEQKKKKTENKRLQITCSNIYVITYPKEMRQKTKEETMSKDYPQN